MSEDPPPTASRATSPSATTPPTAGGAPTSDAGTADEGPVPPPKPSRTSRAGRDLPAAIGVGLLLGAVLLVSLFTVKAVFCGVVVVAVLVGLRELTGQLKDRRSIDVPLPLVGAGAIAMIVTAYLRGPYWLGGSLALTGLALMVWRLRGPADGFIRDTTAGLFTAFYLPFLAGFVALTLAARDGDKRVLVFLLLTVCSDTGAYAVGWKFGKHKLAPSISPGKTREGLAGSAALCMLAGALCLQYLLDGGHWWQGLVLGVAVSASATLGDLCESMMKRDLGVKDMGALLPGHGGLMDRLDSLLPTAPVVWLVLAAFLGVH